MTYCDKTGPDEFALYMNGNQLSFLAKKLTGDNSPEARKLCRAIFSELTCRKTLPASNNRQLAFCSECGGIGKIRVHILEPDEVNFVKCKRCNGTGKLLKLTATRYQVLTKEMEQQLIPFPGKEVSQNDWPGGLND